jgi:hypothetical protein
LFVEGLPSRLRGFRKSHLLMLASFGRIATASGKTARFAR